MENLSFSKDLQNHIKGGFSASKKTIRWKISVNTKVMQNSPSSCTSWFNVKLQVLMRGITKKSYFSKKVTLNKYKISPSSEKASLCF